MYRLGEAEIQLGKFHEARVALSRSDQLKHDMPETLYMLGKAANLDGDDALAQKSWMHLLTLENNTSLAGQAHFGLAGIYRKQGKTAEAEKEMELFRKLQSNASQTDEPPKGIERKGRSHDHAETCEFATWHEGDAGVRFFGRNVRGGSLGDFGTGRRGAAGGGNFRPDDPRPKN